MFDMERAKVNGLRHAFPVGSRIKCIQMVDDPHPIPPNTEGTVSNIDDLGTIHVKWDNGRRLGLAPGVDQFISLEGKDE